MSTASTETWQLRRSYNSYKPISMIPAGGWQVVYAYRETSKVRGDKYAHAHPLMAFVLAEEEWTIVRESGRRETTREGRCIMGYDPDAHGIISPASEANNFIAYLAPGMPIPDNMEQAARKYVLSHESESESASTEKESTNESPERESP